MGAGPAEPDAGELCPGAATGRRARAGVEAGGGLREPGSTKGEGATAARTGRKRGAKSERAATGAALAVAGAD